MDVAVLQHDVQVVPVLDEKAAEVHGGLLEVFCDFEVGRVAAVEERQFADNLAGDHLL